MDYSEESQQISTFPRKSVLSALKSSAFVNKLWSNNKPAVYLDCFVYEPPALASQSRTRNSETLTWRRVARAISAIKRNQRAHQENTMSTSTMSGHLRSTWDHNAVHKNSPEQLAIVRTKKDRQKCSFNLHKNTSREAGAFRWVKRPEDGWWKRERKTVWVSHKEQKKESRWESADRLKPSKFNPINLWKEFCH